MSGPSLEIDVQGELHCELNRAPLTIRAADGVAVVEVPDFATAFKLCQLGSICGSYVSRLRRLKTGLDLARLQLELRLRSRLLLRIGWETGNPLWRFVGLPPLHLSLRPLLLGQ